MTRFVVTGCASSGTTYVSRLLTELGVSCGHERVYRMQSRDGQVVVRDDGQTGDSSSFAAALLPLEATVVHLVRPPLDVISTLTGRRLLSETRRPLWYFVRSYLPEVADQPAGVARAATYWLSWNARVAEHADLTWQLPLFASEVMALSDTCGLGLDEDQVIRVLASLPHDINHHDGREVSLAELGDLAEPVKEAANSYGVALTGGLAHGQN